MISRNVLTRLEMLEERMMPAGEPQIINVVFIEPGTMRQTGGFKVEIPACGRARGHSRQIAAAQARSRSAYR